MWANKPEMAKKWVSEYGHADGWSEYQKKKKKKKSSETGWYKVAKKQTSILSISGPNTTEILQFLTVKMGVKESFIMQDEEGIRFISSNPDHTKRILKMKFPDVFIADKSELEAEASTKGLIKVALNEKTLVIDFDNTIAEDNFPQIGAPKPNVKEALEQLKENGYTIRIFSCRTNQLSNDKNPEEEKSKIEAWLTENQIPFDGVEMGTEGKPFAGHYIDDKAIEYDNNWQEIVNRLLGE